MKITALQPRLRIDKLDYNLEQYCTLFHEYATIIQTTDVICFPEYWNGMRKGSYTENFQMKSLDFLTEKATQLSVWVIGGSHLVKEKSSYFNRSHVINPSGRLIGTYDKHHPFGYERVQEITPGIKNLTWKIAEWKATIQICSDLWNTKDYSLLIKKNPDIIFSPILTTIPNSTYTNYGRFMWYNLAVIRAKEAAAAVIVSDSAMQVIRDPYWCAGASCIADPSWRFTNEEPLGKKILSSIPDGSRGIVSGTLELNRIRQQREYRKEMGLLLT